MAASTAILLFLPRSAAGRSQYMWTRKGGTQEFTNGAVTIDFDGVGRAGHVRFTMGGRTYVGYVESVRSGRAFWPATLKTEDGDEIPDGARDILTEYVVERASSFKAHVEVLR